MTPLARCHLVTAGMLIVGWGTAVVIYATAAPDEDNPLAEFEESKKYLADIERVGGKIAVFSTEVKQWVASLWHGQSLAFTIAALTTVVALGYLITTTRRLASSEPRMSG